MITPEVEFIAAGGNRHPAAADWDHDSGLLAFGADRNIALWYPLDSTRRGIYALLPGHTDKVNVVKLLSLEDSSRVIISGSVDKTIIIWVEDKKFRTGFKILTILRDHSGSINCLAVHHGSNVFISGAADATIKVWRIALARHGPAVVNLIDDIALQPRFFPLALALLTLDENQTSLALAIGGTKSIIQIYIIKNIKATISCNLKATLCGHEGWIRSLDFIHESWARNDILLASASQDKYIRLWRLHDQTEAPRSAEDSTVVPSSKTLSNKAYNFDIGSRSYSITFEALLLGHEDWVYSATWKRVGSKLHLLTASADNTLSIWESSASSGVWIATTRLGELSAQKGSTTATGSTGGFWIGLWSPQGDSVVSLGRTGSWRLWKWDQVSRNWMQHSAISGHIRAGKAISWERDGAYLLSTSSDQTTRLFAEWRRNGQKSWHELSRPQIHGYDLNCIDVFSNSSFVSGADEKLLRIFDEPGDVASTLKRLCGIEGHQEAIMAYTANMPVLGLSNKAVASEDQAFPESSPEAGSEAYNSNGVSSKDEPPLEDQLSRHTLWPEREKLYGHGYEISSVATSHDGSLVATACRASSIDHAVIRVFRVNDWLEVKPSLKAHSLTITRLRFSEDDQVLLSVGRDRQWAVFRRDQQKPNVFNLLASNPRGHSRMILDASWAPNTPKGKRRFASAGRDKLVKIWEENSDGFENILTFTEGQAVTAVDFSSKIVNGALALAIGLEDGRIRVSLLDAIEISEQGSCSFDSQILPSMSITQLAWRPALAFLEPKSSSQGKSRIDGETAELAASSEDSSIRIYSMSL